MSDKLRLIFPQWQGGESSNISSYVTELSPKDAAQGYFLGSKLLQWLAPPSNVPVETVPVSLDDSPEAIATEKGIFAYKANITQLQAALNILQIKKPKRIVTLGGECSVSVAPFTYLASQYPDDVAILWIDAHPDLGVPGDPYTGFHAMALAQTLGLGDPEITAMLPKTVDPKNALFVGLRCFIEPAEERRKKLGIPYITSEVANKSSQEILDWIKQTGKSKILIHFDLDVLEPTELKIAVGFDPDGISLDAMARIIADVAKNYDLVGLTVAEPMPREVIKLRNLLNTLPLF